MTHNLSVQATMVGKALQQEREAAGLVASMVRKGAQLTFSYYSVWNFYPMDDAIHSLGYLPS